MFNFTRFLSRSLNRSQRRVRRSAQPMQVEALEVRQMPATLVSPTTLTYQDLDGDSVTVTFSQSILNAGNVNTIFTFSSGMGAVNGNNNTKQLLQKVALQTELPVGSAIGSPPALLPESSKELTSSSAQPVMPS